MLALLIILITSGEVTATLSWNTVCSSAPWNGAIPRVTRDGGNYFLVSGVNGYYTPMQMFRCSDGGKWKQRVIFSVNWVVVTSTNIQYPYGPCFVAYNSTLYVMGGAVNGAVYLNDVWSSSDLGGERRVN